MKYKNHYDRLIEKAKSRPTPKGYCETHHIIPKSMGGCDVPENLVVLTAREHFIAHFFLAKIYGGKQWCAASLMSRRFKTNSRTYETMRQNWNNEMSGSNSPMFGRTRPDAAKRLKTNNPMHLSEIAKKQGNAMRGSKNPQWGKTGGKSATSKSVCLHFTNNTVKYFDSVAEAAKELNIARTNISNWLSGYQKIPSKYNLKFVLYC